MTTVREALTEIESTHYAGGVNEKIEAVCRAFGLEPDGPLDLVRTYLVNYLDRAQRAEADVTILLRICHDQIDAGWEYDAAEKATITAITSRAKP